MVGMSKFLRMEWTCPDDPRMGDLSPCSEDEDRELAVSAGVVRGGVVDQACPFHVEPPFCEFDQSIWRSRLPSTQLSVRERCESSGVAEGEVTIGWTANAKEECGRTWSVTNSLVKTDHEKDANMATKKFAYLPWAAVSVSEPGSLWSW